MNADFFVLYIKLMIVNNIITIHKTDSDNDDVHSSLKKHKVCKHSSVYIFINDENCTSFSQDKAGSS